MSLLNMTKHPFQSGKLLRFPSPAPPTILSPEPKNERIPQHVGLLAAHSESSIMMGDSQIALQHTDDIVMGNGVNSLGANAVQVLTEILMKPSNGLNEVMGAEISGKLVDDVKMIAAHELPPIMMNGFNQAVDALKLGGFLIDDFKQELFGSLMSEGVPGLTQAHLKLINTNESYSRRYM